MKSWPTKKLGEVAEYINGRAFKPTDWGEIGLPIIRIQNLTETQEKFNYFNGRVEDRYLVKNGDILLSWSASLGVYIWNNGDAVLNQHIFKVVPSKDINKSYLFYALIVAVEELKRRVHGSTMTHVTKPIFNRVTTKIPPLQIQKQIVERLDKIAEAQKLNGDLIQKTDELFQSLLHKELNPAGKNWESKKLGDKDVIEIIDGDRGKNYPPKNEFQKTGFCLFLNTKNVTSSGFIFAEVDFIPKERDKKLRKGKLQRNDIVLTTRGTIGNSALYDDSVEFDNVRINSGMVILRPNTKQIIPKLLWILMGDSMTQKQFKRILSGTAQPQLPITNLVKIKIPLPPLQTQRQIVAKLSAVQNYKTQLLAQKSKLKELFNSVLSKSFSG